MKDGIVYRQYTPDPTADCVVVPIIPCSYQTRILQQYHDAASAGYVRQPQRYESWDIGWVCFMMLSNTVENVQLAKHLSPRHHRKSLLIASLLGNLGKWWLYISLSCHNNRYILVKQDYFTKWAEAVPLPNQTAAATIT